MVRGGCVWDVDGGGEMEGRICELEAVCCLCRLCERES